MSEERAERPVTELPGVVLPGTGQGDARLSTAERRDPRRSTDPQQTTEPPRTGLEAVDRVLAREAEVAELPVTERAAAYEALHAELERILEERPGSLPSGLTGQTGGAGSSDGTGQPRGASGGGVDARGRSAR